MVAEIAALDLWNIFVTYVFGSFWMAVVGITLLIGIIMGVLGRISVYSLTWYCVMFVCAMTLGYGYVTITLLITLAIMVAFFFSLKGYLDKT
jgi:hypothetical protein